MPDETSNAAEQFLKGLASTHDNDQLYEGLDDLASMFFAYFKRLQNKGFHYSKAFILTRDMHGIWWNGKVQHEMIHMHEHTEGEDPHG